MDTLATNTTAPTVGAKATQPAQQAPAQANFTSDTVEKKKRFTFSAWSVSAIKKHIRQSNLPDGKTSIKKEETKDAEL